MEKEYLIDSEAMDLVDNFESAIREAVYDLASKNTSCVTVKDVESAIKSILSSEYHHIIKNAHD